MYVALFGSLVVIGKVLEPELQLSKIRLLLEEEFYSDPL